MVIDNRGLKYENPAKCTIHLRQAIVLGHECAGTGAINYNIIKLYCIVGRQLKMVTDDKRLKYVRE